MTRNRCAQSHVGYILKPSCAAVHYASVAAVSFPHDCGCPSARPVSYLDLDMVLQVASNTQVRLLRCLGLLVEGR